MKKELTDKSLANVTGGTAPTLPATTLGPSNYTSPEIPTVKYNNENTDWSSDKPTDTGDYKVDITF